ncbi:TerD family protein [Actinokineospora enzanensis]|uniref:TerD family protein n=1 Tax=Actinokineospora enzanensis TaxID=155975 RepID=UPI000376281B|nr:TerD family protein [Actinokineospora enzanensis]
MLDQTIIRRTLRVPRATGPAGDGSPVARQLDAVLLGVGFTASGDLLRHLTGLAPGPAMDVAVRVVGAVRELVGDHVEHNAYFRYFPRGVPNTVEFWMECLRDALLTDSPDGPPESLVDLPRYGRCQHTFADLLAAHDELVPSAKDRVTVVHLGGTLEEETRALYLALAGSVAPLGEADRELLAELTVNCGDVVPPEIPVRENRAVVNAVRLAAGLPLVLVDTVVDVLRVACQASGGDVTLAETTRFRSFTRRERRALMAALDRVVGGNGGKLGDVARYSGPFKRLGERIHPHEHQRYPHAQEVFTVARGERTVRSLAARAELAFVAGDVRAAAEILIAAPGMLARSLDRLLRTADTPADLDAVLTALTRVITSISGRVLCSLREHLANRGIPDAERVFTNQAGRGWAAPDTRPPLPIEVIGRVNALIDGEVAARLPEYGHLVVDPAVLDVALPLSGKASADGFAVLPRGSRSVVDGELLRFFTYWRQTRHSTDFDLSAVMLDADFTYIGHVSWTNIRDGGAVYSGDIIEAPNGATEFIQIPLDSVTAAYVVPQVNVYDGEGFAEVAESLFGWMTRDREQEGAPFEARTVRTRSELRGSGRVALPVVFGRAPDGTWTATWTHLYLSGSPKFNRVEANQLSTGLLVRALVSREYLTVRYLVELCRGKVTEWSPGMWFDGPVTYVGLHEPDGLPAGSTVITLDGLNRLIPS